VFYFSNGQFHISYVDSLFLCVTSITVCGLATVDLSSLTPFQQALIFIQMFIGSPIIVSLVVVQSRKCVLVPWPSAQESSDMGITCWHYLTITINRWMFEAHLEPIVRRAAKLELGDEKPPIRERVAFKLGKLFSSKSNQTPHATQSASDTVFRDAEGVRGVNSGGGARVHAGMIRRTSNAPQRVNPSGFVLEEAKQTTTAETPPQDSVLESRPSVSDSPGPCPRASNVCHPQTEYQVLCFVTPQMRTNNPLPDQLDIHFYDIRPPPVGTPLTQINSRRGGPVVSGEPPPWRRMSVRRNERRPSCRALRPSSLWGSLRFNDGLAQAMNDPPALGWLLRC
jgi:hypothetical protein